MDRALDRSLDEILSDRKQACHLFPRPSVSRAIKSNPGLPLH